MQKSMFISHGFALHITWNGERGLDQFKTIWFKRDGYAVDENGVYKFLLSEG